MQKAAALDQIREVYEAGEIVVNGRVYELVKMRHEKRLQVFSLFSTAGSDISQGNFSVLATPAFKHVEKIMLNSITFDGDLLARLTEHWEEYPEDYLEVVSTGMAVLSYPFLKGQGTGSQSQKGRGLKTTSKKPI